MSTLLQIHANSDPRALRDIRTRVQNALIGAGLRGPAVAEMDVAVGEALENVHRHAYRGDGGPLFVAVFRSALSVSIIVMDLGNTTNVPVIPRREPPATQREGRGLYIAQELADALIIQVNMAGHGLAVQIIKRLHAIGRAA